MNDCKSAVCICKNRITRHYISLVPDEDTGEKVFAEVLEEDGKYVIDYFPSGTFQCFTCRIGYHFYTEQVALNGEFDIENGRDLALIKDPFSSEENRFITVCQSCYNHLKEKFNVVDYCDTGLAKEEGEEVV